MSSDTTTPLLNKDALKEEDLSRVQHSLTHSGQTMQQQHQQNQKRSSLHRRRRGFQADVARLSAGDFSDDTAAMQHLQRSDSKQQYPNGPDSFIVEELSDFSADGNVGCHGQYFDHSYSPLVSF
jgi:hypothetical protein